MSSIIKEYFPQLSPEQEQQFALARDLYLDWNSKINVISRKDTDNFNERHLLHSLSISKAVNFVSGTKILDIGTGGGFPGIPLAILYPQVQFTLVDSVGKKIKVVKEIASELNLKNVVAENTRAENIKQKFDFIVSRAVTKMDDFVVWTKGKFSDVNKNEIENGILYLKGGDLTEELKNFKDKVKIYNLKEFFSEEFFETKKLVYLPQKNIKL